MEEQMTRTAKSMYGGTIEVGSEVERIDNYQRGGKVMAINPDRGTHSVLVRWPILDDVWWNPRDLLLKSEKSAAALPGTDKEPDNAD